MTPVTLRLKNFLSYGSAAEELDFGAFSVACLSGGNGQGKSALLDALTWAVWGEARKSSDRQKPDEELLRIGARDMEVEFTFDLEGTRYRVVRSFHQSASGKTSKPGLEFHVLDPERGAFRPLTAESVRATQAVIDRKVGIDYDTFINSAFLLQGRSDEFTRKRPGDRKEILGRILGLDRYGRLAAAAGQRHGDARERAARQEAEAARLQEGLATEPQWKQERDETAAAVDALGAACDALRSEENALRAELASLDAVLRQAGTYRDALGRLAERRGRLDDEAAALAGQIDEAEALVARADAIERDHARYQALVGERDALDERAQLRQSLETQRQKQLLALQEATMKLENGIERVRQQIEMLRARLVEDEQRLLYEHPVAREEVRKSEEAGAEHARLHAQSERHRALRARLEQLDRQLDAERNQIAGRLTGLQQRVKEAETAAVSVAALKGQAATLAAEATEIEGWTREQEGVYEAGTEVKAALAAAEAERGRLDAARVALDARRARLRATDDEVCPTCGTPLTDAHRHTVEATYDRERAQLDAAFAAQDGEVRRLTERRDALRAQYLALRDRIASKNGAVTELARVQQRIEQATAAEAALATHRAEAERLRRRLDAEDYLLDVRADHTAVQDQLTAEPFDDAHFEAVKREADRLGDRRTRRDALDALAEESASRRREVERREGELGRLRTDLDGGEKLRPFREAIARVDAQIQAAGYDGARHEAVRQALAALKEAPGLFMKLMTAHRDLTGFHARRAVLADDRAGLAREEAEHAGALAAAEAKLGRRSEVEARHAARAEERGALEVRWREAQARLGGLEERLQRCAADRGALQQVRADLREAKREATLYRHLRSAFGRNGIPSLIIEETLPEIEERANVLLERLSSGRTRVALETLADKKAGGTKETLDIRITDEQGVARSYETYSGGEAFRVNFALRIALAQLLTERAGVRVRTLVVDEGFGTQDKEGIQNLVEAIRTIQDDFDKILVVTHLDELKDAFPIRIEVTKRPVEGSTFEVVGV